MKNVFVVFVIIGIALMSTYAGAMPLPGGLQWGMSLDDISKKYSTVYVAGDQEEGLYYDIFVPFYGGNDLDLRGFFVDGKLQHLQKFYKLKSFAAEQDSYTKRHSNSILERMINTLGSPKEQNNGYMSWEDENTHAWIVLTGHGDNRVVFKIDFTNKR